jgi:hypothetical protein
MADAGKDSASGELAAGKFSDIVGGGPKGAGPDCFAGGCAGIEGATCGGTGPLGSGGVVVPLEAAATCGDTGPVGVGGVAMPLETAE